MTDIERRPIFSYLADDDLFHCENDSPVDMKIYISQIRLEYQGELDIARDQLKIIVEAHNRDNKEKQRYQNALIMITSFDHYPQQTALEIQMFNIASMALGGNTQADIDAVEYWVNECDKRDYKIEHLRKVLESICALDLKSYENERFYGADELKKIAYEGLKNE